MKRISKNILCICWFVMIAMLFPGVAFCKGGGIVAFGDSLTEGCYIDGASECGWEGGFAYWNELEALLLSNDFDVKVYNHGRGGEVTVNGVNRLKNLLASNLCDRDIEYVLIMEGTNDLLHHYSVGVIIFNLTAMIDNSRNAGVEPLIATIPPDPDNEYKEIGLLNSEIRDLAVAKNVTLVDQYNALAPKWSDYTPGCIRGDRTHPNRAGFDAMGTVWYENLHGLLPKKSLGLPAVNFLLRSPSS